MFRDLLRLKRRCQTSSVLGRLSLVLVASVAFGALASVVKGNGIGPREALGNMSAPWLALPYVASLAVGSRKVVWAAALGALVSVTALAGFYCADSAVLNLGGHSWLENLRLTLNGGHLYFLRALVTGPMFGALAAMSSAHRRRIRLTLIGALFALEPVAQFGRRGYQNSVDHYLFLWIAELLVGLAVICIGLRSQKIARTRHSIIQGGVAGAAPVQSPAPTVSSPTTT
jgi:hypothetical protein